MVASRKSSICETPQVTVVIPAFNAERFIRIAVRSALAQTIDKLEVLVIDDGSTDSTVTIVEQEARRDPRVRVQCMGKNSGAGAARNRGFALARGQWIAVMDSDDLMAPNRLERLVHEGNLHGADMIADNLARFWSTDNNPTPVFRQRNDFEIDAEHYLANNHLFSNSLQYGLLQPIFRASSVRRAGESYDEQLRIMEDDDFYLRLLLRGLRFRVHPSITYFYRQRSDSLSVRMSQEDVSKMIDLSRRLVSEFCNHPLADLLSKRHRALERAADYLGLIAAMKRKDVFTSVRIVCNRPSSLPLLHTPLRKAVHRVFGPVRPPHKHHELRAALGEAMRLAGEGNNGHGLTDAEGAMQTEQPPGAHRV